MKLIDGDLLATKAKPAKSYHGNMLVVCVGDIVAAPEVDAVPVVRGKWFRETEYDMQCSECAMCWRHADNETYKFDYCPNCGAKMEDGE